MSRSKQPRFFTVNRIRAESGGSAGRLNVYGTIQAEQLFAGEESYTPNKLLAELDALGAINQLDVHIFSPGGDYDAGMAMYAELRQRSEMVNAYVDGLAASMATIIMCAADNVYIAENARLLIHRPELNGFMRMHEEDAREAADGMVMAAKVMAQIYAKRTGKTEAEMLAVMEGKSGEGTWFTAEEAIASGFADDYTPDAKRPIEIAACLKPAIFSYAGHVIDMSQYPNAAAMTAGISQSSKGVNQMFGSKKPKRQAQRRARTRAEVTLVDMICPHCGADVLLNPETAEVVLAGNPGDNSGGDGAATVAKRAMSNLRAELFTVACPSCGEEFIWDTDANSDGDTGEGTTDTTPMGAGGDAAASAQAKKPAGNAQAKKPAAKNTVAMNAEMAEAVCPECSSVVPYDTEIAEITTDEAGVEGYALACQECGAYFVEPLEAAAPEAIPAGMGAQAAYRLGVRAERARIAALDEMANAAPALSAMIGAAKRSGASAQAMSRNVFKAMANNPAVKGQQQLGAAMRDAENSGVNGMRLPAHFNTKAQFNDMVTQRLEERN